MVSFDMAASILNLGKKLVPDRFPAPDPDVAAAWAEALDRNYPPELWKDAVLLWSRGHVRDRMCSPGDMLDAAAKVAKRWESDPVKGKVLEGFRRDHYEARYRVLLGDRYSPEQVPDVSQRAIAGRGDVRVRAIASRAFRQDVLKSRPRRPSGGV